MVDIWNNFFIRPIITLLMAFYQLFQWFHIPGPLGFAVIALTISIRLLLYPLMNAQLKSAKKMQQLKPHLDALSAKHKDNKQALQQAQLELYKQHGVNPAAGCLPLLIQMPVLIALYNVFYRVLQNGNLSKVVVEINQLVYFSSLKIHAIDLSFVGISLGIKPNQWQHIGWWLLAIPLVTAALQYWQSQLMMPQMKSAVTTQRVPVEQNKVKNEDKKDGKKEQSPEDTALEMQKQMAMITPLMFGMFAYQFPLGLALYWNVFGLFGIMQQLAINRQN